MRNAITLPLHYGEIVHIVTYVLSLNSSQIAYCCVVIRIAFKVVAELTVDSSLVVGSVDPESKIRTAPFSHFLSICNGCCRPLAALLLGHFSLLYTLSDDLFPTLKSKGFSRRLSDLFDSRLSA